jgi:hypothetical protein
MAGESGAVVMAFPCVQFASMHLIGFVCRIEEKGTMYLRKWPTAINRAALLIALSLFTTSRAEADLLSSSVQFANITQTYTYSYSIDNTYGTSPIAEISILIDSRTQIYPPSVLLPISHTEPTGWFFSMAISGSSANPPLNEFGTFWKWDFFPGLTGGETLSGFSFSTEIAPSPNFNNNYFIYSGPVANEGAILEYGHIAAPDHALPEPSTLAIAGLSGALWLCYVWHRRKKVTT